MKKNKMTQTQKIKAHLLKKNFITSWEAITRYRITRLSARIFDLRDSGLKIKTESHYNKKTKTFFAKYVLQNRK